MAGKLSHVSWDPTTLPGTATPKPPPKPKQAAKPKPKPLPLPGYPVRTGLDAPTIWKGKPMTPTLRGTLSPYRPSMLRLGK